MAARAAPQLPVSRRSEPAFREQRRQKVEEYLSRKKTFSGVSIQENQTSISSRTRRATTSKLQDELQPSTSPKPEMENKENADEVSWDQSIVNSETNVTLNSSTVPLTSYISGTNCSLEKQAPENKVIDIKSQHVSLSKAIMEIKRIKERHLTTEKQNASISAPKKPALGRYRGKVIQSKINSFWKAAKNEGEKSSLPDKKTFPSATNQAANSLSTKSCNAVLKTVKVTNNTKSVKSNGVLPFQSKPSDKAASNSQSGLKKQLTFAAAPKKVTVPKVVGGRRPQPLKAASSNPDRKVRGVKKCADFCEDARPEALARSTFVAPGAKSRHNSKMDENRKSILPKESVEERRARLDEWRASRGKVMRRPPIRALLGSQSKSEEQEFSAADTEKINKTLSKCLHLTEQGHHSDEARAMLEDLIISIPGVKKLAKYWICCMRLEQMGHLGKLIAVYEEAILAGAMPREELRHTLVDTIKNTEGLFNSDNGGTVIEAHLSEIVEVSKEPNSSVEPVQETFKDLCPDDDQKEESDNKAETSSEVIKKEEIDLDLKPRGESLPKKNKKHRAKERAKKKAKCEREQKEDGIKNTAQAINSPEKENDTSYSMRFNPSTTPYLESVKMHPEANDCSAKDLKIITPLRYSQRIREKMCKLPDAVKDQDACVSSLEQLGDLESKSTVFIHKQSNALQETSSEIEE
ncbi:cytoskeleton-associated protein 2 isoform X2 [Motacilla alba alba]|uniref:cytoskeleton-associated protein 2 isoform X2 n=1 Tax=Motacilla alba alba TaxID=1094192 RepID=UPI0018D4F833|nr:cytoskeleton-associated protein 2 isoform X2 [Motacilla alba alba]